MRTSGTPWRPERLAGRGGLGVVWEARDPHSGLRVAMKVLPGLSGEGAPAFLSEVRAVATLHHPNVVRVYDLGVIDADQAEASGGAFPVGAPFLVMEWVGGGPLASVATWAELRSALEQSLRALAHAHARGVLHRDLKPGNVLLGGPGDLRPGLKLVDFGLARLSGVGASAGSGTPAYMAPEQVSGGPEGPTTDLYALGLMAWQLATGVVPAASDSVAATLAARVVGALPPFEPTLDVPEGFGAWLTRMLARWPDERFPFAADALRGLAELGEPVPSFHRKRVVIAAQATVALDESMRVPLLPVEVGAPTPAPLVGVEIPPTWHPVDIEPVGQVGLTGLRLFGLRDLPLVGRAPERTALWNALRAAAGSRRPRAVVLRGPAGLGKSRLARALAEEVHTLGVAVPVRAAVGRPPAPDRVLRDVIDDAWKLPLDGEARARAVARLPEAAERAFGEGERLAARLAATVDLLRAAAGERPVVLWLDDAQWSSTAVALAQAILREPDAGATLVVLTVQEEALADRPTERAALERFTTRRDVAVVPVGALPSGELETLLDGLVQLEPVTRRIVVEQSAGNPLLAIRLLDAWILRGELVETPRGLGLSTAPVGGRLAAEAVVGDELEALLSARPDSEGVALERAAVLGDQVQAAEWAAALAIEGLVLPTALLDRLLDRGILRPRPGGWSFAQPLFRLSLLRRAAEAGREPVHHRAAAAVVGESDLARLGEHWLAAGEPLRAADALLRAAEAERRVHAIAAGGVALRSARAALEAAKVEPGDARWGECLLLEMWIAATSVSPAVGAVAAARAVAWAEEHGDEPKALEARCREILCRAQSGEAIDAVGELRHAWERALAAGAPRMIVTIGDFYASELRNRGMFADAALVARRILVESERGGYRLGRGTAWRHLGVFARMQGRVEEARFALEKAREELEPHTWEHAETCNNLGDLLRETGRSDEAIAWYEHAAARFRAMGSFDTCVPLMNLSLLHIGEGRLEAADALLQRCVASLAQSEQRRMEAIARVIRLPALAARGDRVGFDAELAAGRPPLEDTGYVDPDVAWALERAGEEARRQGWTDAAEAVETWAAAQRRALGG